MTAKKPSHSHLARTPPRLRHREVDIVEHGKQQYHKTRGEQHLYEFQTAARGMPVAVSYLREILLGEGQDNSFRLHVLQLVYPKELLEILCYVGSLRPKVGVRLCQYVEV